MRHAFLRISASRRRAIYTARALLSVHHAVAVLSLLLGDGGDHAPLVLRVVQLLLLALQASPHTAP
jgi:hypothetical protein